ncbi:DUF1648 domain-containing protein [Collinsella tanakaei]|nr:DUF1648 domain-containing protein [Collinsella tanakaei]
MDEPTAKPLSPVVTAVCLLLALSPAIALAVSWGMLPDVVPAHWGAEGIDRWGPKVEMVAVPAVTFLASGGLLFGARRATGDERVSFLNGSLGERAVMVVSSMCVSLVGLVSLICWIMAALQPEATADAGEVAVLSWQVLGVPAIFLVAGILLALRALNMPEAEELLEEQYHAQRIAGAIMVVAGAVMAVLSALVLSGTMIQVGQAAIAAVAMVFVFVLLKRWL